MSKINITEIDYYCYEWAQRKISLDRPISGVYMIHNKDNNRIYIGQSINIHKRWEQHIKDSSNSLIHQAIKKYGKDSFDFWILEECPRDELLKKEYEWGCLFSECYAPVGYNIVQCGFGTNNFLTSKEVSCYNSVGELIQTFPSINEAARVLSLISNDISECTKDQIGARTSGGLYWRLGKEKNIEITKPLTGKYGGKTVYQYNLVDGALITSFNSLADAERFLEKEGANKNISSCCNWKLKSAYGFGWSYELVADYLQYRDYKPRKVIVSSYNFRGEKIKTYNSLTEAALDMKTTKGNIWVCCKNLGRTCRKLLWQYGDKERIEVLNLC